MLATEASIQALPQQKNMGDFTALSHDHRRYLCVSLHLSIFLNRFRDYHM